MIQPPGHRERDAMLFERRETDIALGVIQVEVAHVQGDLDKMRSDLEKHIERTEQTLSKLEQKLESGMDRMDQKFIWLIGGILATLLTLLSDKLF